MKTELQELVELKIKVRDLLEVLRNKLYIVKDSPEINNEEFINELISMLDKQLESSKLKIRNNPKKADISFLNKLRRKHPNLTPGQEKIAQLVFIGLTSNDSAEVLQVSPKTVVNRIYSLSKKIKPENYHTLRQYLLSIY